MEPLRALAVIHAEAAASHRQPPALAVTGQTCVGEIDALASAGFAAHLASGHTSAWAAATTEQNHQRPDD